MKNNNERLSALSVSGHQVVQSNPLIESFGKERRWLNWKPVDRAGKTTKVPYAVNGRMASSTDPSTWSTYPEASAKSANTGIVFMSEKSLLGIDIDHCLSDGVIEHVEAKAIRELVEKAATYTEVSPSGTGLHLYLKISSPLKLERNRHSNFEAYTEGRYFTTTFHPFEKLLPVRTVSPEEAYALLSVIGYPWGALKGLQRQRDVQVEVKTPPLDDEFLLKLMFSAKNGGKIRALYDGDISTYKDDDSRADLALLAYLAFWTRKDANQMERLWLASPLGKREKTQKVEDYRNRTIAVAIKGCNKIYAAAQKQKKKEREQRRTAAEFLLDRIDGSENMLLFHDDKGEAYIALEVLGHREIWPCNSKAARRWLSREYWNLAKTAAPSEAIKNVIAVLEGRASFDGPLHKLAVRSAINPDGLWYDLTDDGWQAVKITEQGWEVIQSPPILFRRYSHSRPQVRPATTGGDVSLFLKYLNIKDPQQRLLLQVFLVSCFIPEFAHVMLVVFGSQGSAKSTLSKFLRRVIDPSIIEVASMPDTPKELIQTLAHHAFLFFDNVSYISEIMSDIICKAITGSGFPKRELYSDDEDIIYTFKRCIGINGINLVSTRPDLLERSLLIELDRIPDTERKQERELLENFENDLPLILGGVFDTLAKALRIKPSIKLNSTPRMADFAVWGCAIAEALGYAKEEFLTAYEENISKQNQVVLNEQVIAEALMSFMESREEWRGTASDLLRELTIHATSHQVDTFEKYWPKASNTLMRRLNELKVNLRQVGISITSIPGNTREVILSKVKSGTDDTDGSS